MLTSTPDGHLVDFDIIYSDGENSWMGNFTIPVNAPLFLASNPVFNDADENGTWDAGESVTLSINCANNGSADFFMYPGAELSTTSEYINIGENNPFIWYGMFAGTSDNAIFILESDADTPNGHLDDEQNNGSIFCWYLYVCIYYLSVCRISEEISV